MWAIAAWAYLRQLHPMSEPFAPYQALWWPTTFGFVWLPALALVLRGKILLEMATELLQPV